MKVLNPLKFTLVHSHLFTDAPPSPLQSSLPPEILDCIFTFLSTSSPLYFDIPMSPIEPWHFLLNCTRVCKRFAAHCLPILHRMAYSRHIIHRIRLPLQSNDREWALICFMARASVASARWGIGALRLFWFEEELDIHDAMQAYPDPLDPVWETFLSCSLDIRQSFMDLAFGLDTNVDETALESLETDFDVTNKLVKGQINIPMMLKHSERMDLGAFLIFVRVSAGSLLLRVKPVGDQFEYSEERRNVQLIIWDAIIYGSCTHCSLQLEKMQVCAECRVAQYCSRECQKKDWDQVHRHECKNLGFRHF